ncbi:MAG: bifunctional 4-hydroxy-2-oxoglutarate aldolase/2-dehydro-3-deoxy-phosphogluconate aldolase [Aestuariivita sp.]|nr:bifunctional 4-hydroxy-2-oxoglutarate aldolase/2-dehydro-3-deoxy-phosphogluconate aldolase [Aestuariivita sp.]MCY4201897.1 bifunctional 4-hydroxy-2-oxoglutarate aldolase/2-dehydro-3-deoxy-phosphogluconate aldolase [Aestuariivita sp.]
MSIIARDSSRIIREICGLAPVMPVLVVNELKSAKPLAEALVSGGIIALEVTLRTPVALDVIRAMSEVAGAHVGAGTLITADDVRAAKQAGAKFGVSPGATAELLSACEKENLPLLPGVATASEAMKLLARGYDVLKFFPAAASGGVTVLKALGGPLPAIDFCPTGGINANTAASYLALDNVVCVGGSWLTPPDLLEQECWTEITKLANQATKLADGR